MVVRPGQKTGIEMVVSNLLKKKYKDRTNLSSKVASKALLGLTVVGVKIGRNTLRHQCYCKLHKHDDCEDGMEPEIESDNESPAKKNKKFTRADALEAINLDLSHSTSVSLPARVIVTDGDTTASTYCSPMRE